MRNFLVVGGIAVVVAGALLWWMTGETGGVSDSERVPVEAPEVAPRAVKTPSTKGSSRVRVPSEDGGIRPTTGAMEVALRSYFEIEQLDPDAEGAPADETQAFMAALREKTRRMKVAQDAITAAIEADPSTGTDAMLSLSRVYVDMGDFIASSPLPTSLTPKQSEVYADQIRMKAQVQYDKALEVLDVLEDEVPDEARILEIRESIQNR